MIDLQGDPFEQGVQHGQALRDQIGHNLNLYFDRFRREAGLGRDEVLRRSEMYRAAVAADNADYEEGMRGLAAGSGMDIAEIVALNFRYELLYFQYTLKETGPDGGASGADGGADNNGGAQETGGHGKGGAKPDGCTVFAVLPSAMESGNLTLGQNWDWIPEVKGALLRISEPSGLKILGFTEAGILGCKVGFNSAGTGLCINGMLSQDDDWTRLKTPFHHRCHRILRATDFGSATAVVSGEERSCSTNFLIGGTPDRVLDLEVSPTITVPVRCVDGCLAHANHFGDPEAAGVRETESAGLPHSRHRAARLTSLLQTGQPHTLDQVMTHLRDHDGKPNSVCRHEDEQVPEVERLVTITSIIMDPVAGKLWATDGPPCRADYLEYSL
jgi:isopenicillin-N N-acyltransferase like protein